MPDQRLEDPAERPKAFLVDDHVRLRSMLRELLAEAGVDVVGEADNGMAAVRYVPAAAYPDGLVVLLDRRSW